MEFLIDPVLPARKVHLLAGSSGVGKSTLLHQVLDKLRRGEEINGWKTRPTEICYVSGDKDLETYRALEEALGIESFFHVNILDEAVQGGLSPADITLDWLWKNFLSGGRIDLVVLDPADLILQIPNYNDKMQVVRGFFRLWKFCVQHALTSIVVVHTNKTRQNDDYFDVFNRTGGSHSLQGYSHTKALLLSERESPDGFPKLLLRGQRFPEQEIALKRSEDGRFRVLSELDRLQSSWEVLRAWHSPGEELPFFRIAERLPGMAKSTIHRHLKLLEQTGKVTRSAHGHYVITLGH